MPLYSTGSNSDGQLSNQSIEDSSRFVACCGLPTGGTPTSLAFGASHTLAIVAPNADPSHTSSNSLYACGSNARGQLGPSFPSREPTTSFRKLDLGALGVNQAQWEPVRVAACWETSFIVLRPKPETATDAGESDVLIVLGADDWGERASAKRDTSQIDLSDLNPFTPDQQHPAHPNATLRVMKLVAGPRHVVALLSWRSGSREARQVVGWGAARHGQLGLGLFDPCDRSRRTVDRPTLLTLPGNVSHERVRDVSAGREHTVVLLGDGEGRRESGELVLLGSNKHSQLGTAQATAVNVLELPLIPTSLSKVSHTVGATNYSAQCGWSATFVLARDDDEHSQQLHAFGSNVRSQLALPSSSLFTSEEPVQIELPPTPAGQERRLVRMAVGSEHVLLQCETGGEDEVWAWGWNEHGNLGTGDQLDVESPVKVWPTTAREDGSAPRVVGIWAGNATSWIATADSHPLKAAETS